MYNNIHLIEFNDEKKNRNQILNPEEVCIEYMYNTIMVIKKDQLTTKSMAEVNKKDEFEVKNRVNNRVK